MVDTAICTTLLSWDARQTDHLAEKEAELTDSTSGSPLEPKQSYLNFCLENSRDVESLKSSSPDSTGKSPKLEMTLNALQHDPEHFNQHRIYDRPNTIRHFNVAVAPSWSNPLNVYHQRAFSEMDQSSPGAGSSPYFMGTNTISSCMFSPTKANPWFNRISMGLDPWVGDFSQDPTMRSRPCFSSQQTRELEKEFNLCQYITRRRRIELAYALNLTEKQIKTWFQNRRVKERKQKKSTGSESGEEQQ